MRGMDLSKFAKRSVAIVATSALLVAGMSAGVVNAAPESNVGTTGTEFITTWDTTKPGESGSTAVRLPLIAAGTYDFTVDWGDGSTGTIDSGNWSSANTHTYSTAGTYTVTIEGQISGFTFNDGGDGDKLIDVSAWGPLELTYAYEGYFAGADNLNFTATDAPAFGSGASLYQAFYSADSFDSPIGHWEVSGITDFSWAFQNTSFNQDLADWDVSDATTLSGMFNSTTAFDQDLGDWEVSSVNNMSAMFGNAAAFNQDIGDWDVSAVTNMQSMFQGAAAFNQDLSGWDVSNVVNMKSMFQSVGAFDQDIGGWDIGSINSGAPQSMSDMFKSSTLSTPVYNSILTKFATKNKSNVFFCGGNSQYSPGPPAQARQELIDTYGWTLCADGGETAAPGAPTAVAGTPGAGQVALTWDAAPIGSGGNPVTGYLIEKAAGPDFDTWQQTVSDTGSSTTGHTVTALPVGDYLFRISGINSDGTGVPSESSAIVTVSEPAPKVAQQLTFALPAAVPLSQGTLSLTATASSGLPVGYASQTPAVCTVDGSTAALHAVGTCTIEASQPGDDSYLSAEPVTRSVTVASLPAALVDKCPTGSCAGVDLSGVDLAGQNLAGIDFAGANLTGANLSGANLREANLQGANLSGAELREANLRNADLRGANLSDADLVDADLRDANLDKAVAGGSSRTTRGDVGGTYRAPAYSIDLARVNLTGASLRGVRFDNARLTGATLRRADLRRSHLKRANLGKVDARRANFTKADLRRTNLRKANLARADLTRANLRGADLRKTSLTHADLRRTKF